MKKILNILMINLLIFTLLLACFEYFNYKHYYKQFYKNYTSFIKKHKNEQNLFHYSINMKLFDFEEIKALLKKDIIIKKNAPSIVVFGGSFAYGDGLEDKQALSYKLANKTQMNIHTKALSGWGTQHMLYQLKLKDFDNSIQNPKYFIYVYIDHHLHRLFKYQWYATGTNTYPRYKEENGKLVEIKPFLYKLWGLYTVRRIQEIYEDKVIVTSRNEAKRLKLFSQIVNESNKLIKENYPNSKFIILKYNYEDDSKLKNKTFEDLEKNGVIVIDLSKLIGESLFLEKYKLSDGHPNEKAWDTIVPKLAKELEKLN